MSGEEPVATMAQAPLVSRVTKSWQAHRAWHKKYLQAKLEYLKQVLLTTPSFHYTVRCTPLAILITLDEQDYLNCVEDYGSNGITLQRVGLTFIIVHTGGYRQPKRKLSDIRRTQRHELGHVLFDLYVTQNRIRYFSDVAQRVKQAGTSLVRHERYAAAMYQEHAADSRSEIFCYSANQQFDFRLSGIAKGSWQARLKLVNSALCDVANLSTRQRSQLYAIYLTAYKQYLQDIYHYECFIYQLRRQYQSQPQTEVFILALILVTPLESIRSATFPRFQTRLKYQVQHALVSPDILYQFKPLIWQAKQLLKKHRQRPHPRLTLPLVEQLTWTDPASWSFLTTLLEHYIASINLPGADYIPLVHRVIWFCPVDAIQDLAVLLLYCLIKDEKLSPSEIKFSQDYCRSLNRHLPHDSWLRQKIKNLIL